MRFEVTSDSYLWESQLSLFGSSKRDIYFTPEYHRLYELNGGGKAMAAMYSGDNGAKVLYPFLIKPCTEYLEYNQSCYTAESAYGYGGPLTEGCSEKDIEDFEARFHLWCLNNNIVLEYVRFHPLFKNHKLFTRDISIEKMRNTVYIDLEKGIEHIFRLCLSGGCRTAIRKAEKSGVKVSEGGGLDRFVRLYEATMERRNASRNYYFSREYFQALFSMDPARIIVLEATLGDREIASAVFLCYGDYLHYHLTGSDKDYLGYCPNNLIIYKAIEAGIKRGLRKLHLGGGISSSEDDSLFRFKKSFSSDRCEYYTGIRMHSHLMVDINR